MVVMIVLVAIEGERSLRAAAEQAAIFRVILHQNRRTLAADVAVQAHDPVGSAHHHMEVVTDHENGAIRVVAHGFDQPIKGGLARLVEPLGRLVQHQEIGAAKKRTCQQDPLQLTAGEIAHLCLAEAGYADLVQYLSALLRRGRFAERQEAVDSERQAAVEGEALGSVADAQGFFGANTASARPQGADQQPKQRGLAGAVGANDGDDFPRCYVDVDLVQDQASAVLED